MKVYVTLVLDPEDFTSAVLTKTTKTRADAVRQVEQHALERFERMVDPNDGDIHVFPGLTWKSTAGSTSLVASCDHSEVFYEIVETELV